MTHLPQNPSYWLDPDAGGSGRYRLITSLTRLRQRSSWPRPAFNSAVDIDYTTLPVADEVTSVEQLVMDSLGATGTFKGQHHPLA